MDREEDKWVEEAAGDKDNITILFPLHALYGSSREPWHDMWQKNIVKFISSYRPFLIRDVASQVEQMARKLN